MCIACLEVYEYANNNDNRVTVASNDAEYSMEIVEKFLEQTPNCSSDDTMPVYKVQKIEREVKFRHLEFSKLREYLERVIAKSSNI